MAKKTKRAKRKEWSKTDIAALKKYSREKMPVSKIEKLLKRGGATMRSKAWTLGISLGHQKRRKKR